MGTERTSIYSSTGVAPAMAGDRNSYYAKQGDGASIRSSRPAHGRNDSIGGGTTGLSSPLPPQITSERSDKVDKDDAAISVPKEE